jgi:alkylation response protein AidB-like acyl-CoA dehydrogenase
MALPNTDSLLADTVTRLLEDISTNALSSEVEDGHWPEAEWSQLSELGLTRVWLAESLGGAGLAFSEGFTIARLSGRFATPLPLADALVAAFMAGEAGIVLPELLVVSCLEGNLKLDPAGTVSGVGRKVTFGQNADALLAVITTPEGPCVGLIDIEGAEFSVNRTLSGEPQVDIQFNEAPVRELSKCVNADISESVEALGALVRSQQIAGAAEAILEKCVRYAGERKQFGRPIGNFQAIQHHLAAMAGEVAGITCTADAASLASMKQVFQTNAALVAVASAKIRAGASGAEVARIAHQVHGAIGFTQEYDLQRFTRRIWSWRDDYGDEAMWAHRLGQQVVDSPSGELWPLIT